MGRRECAEKIMCQSSRILKAYSESVTTLSFIVVTIPPIGWFGTTHPIGLVFTTVVEAHGLGATLLTTGMGGF